MSMPAAQKLPLKPAGGLGEARGTASLARVLYAPEILAGKPAHPMGKRASVSTTRFTTEAAQVTSPPTPPVPLQDTLVTQKRTGLAAWLRNSGKRLAGLSDQGQFLFLWGAVAPPLGSGPSITGESERPRGRANHPKILSGNNETKKR